MQLQDLQVSGFRNLLDLHMQPGTGLNLVVGPNASGKTALLEAVYLLSRSRSFRTHRIRELIHRGSKRLQVVAMVGMPGGRQIHLGIERDQQQTRLRSAGAPVTNLSAHAHQFPVLLLTPESHELLSGRPQQRRRWLDWALFHVEPHYLMHWQACFAALRQRNVLLKQRPRADELNAWEATLATETARLESLRQRFLEQLMQPFCELAAQLLPGTVALDYDPGRPLDQDYASVLRQQRQDDQMRGFTQAGLHRSDLLLLADGLPARAHLSRGQAKLYIAALVLALGQVLRANGAEPAFLVDDLPAELDTTARARFMALLAATGCQAFVTATELSGLPHPPGSTAVFHVEHGRLNEMVQ